MSNEKWNYVFLQACDLPKEAQSFITMAGIDMSEVKLMHLTPSPNGKFIKSFDKLESRRSDLKFCAIAEHDAIYFISDYPDARCTITRINSYSFIAIKFSERYQN